MTARRSALAAAVMLCGGVLAMPAPAQDSDSARLNAILACGTIDRKSARLSCYDALVRGTPARPAKDGKSGQDQVAVPTSAAAPAPTPTQAFGSEQVKRDKHEREKEVSQILARTVSAVDDGIGHYTITLEDGVRWKMTEAVPGFVPPRQGDMVRIRKAALGSYLMDVNYQGSVRVSRVQ